MPLNPAGVPSMADIQNAIDDAVLAATQYTAYREAAGQQGITITAATFATVALTFPAGRFTVPPLVTATIATAPGGSAKLIPRVTAVTTTGAALYVYTGDGSSATASVSIAWHATQMTPASAAG